MPLQFNRLGITPIVVFNFIIWLFFTLAYFYQIVYILRVLVKGEVKLPKAKKQHRYAFFIAAHNEEPVIGNLVRSILSQDYPRELMDVFVVADAVLIKQLKRQEKLEQLLGREMTLLVKVRAGLWITVLTVFLMSMVTNTRLSLLWTPITWFLQAT